MTQANFNFVDGEILNFNKPEEWSSFDVVKKIRSTIRVKKVGHAGTLDPFASGVLLVCTGAATKQVESLMGLEKEYIAELELGKTTDTYDRTGVVLSESDARLIDAAKLQNALKEFEGEILQTPPMYSAIKVQGRRLYALARRGETIERAPRKIRIHKLEILSFDNPNVKIRIACSKGTYIRALAHDLGARLGCGAHLQSLVRTRIGPHKLEDAWLIPDFVARINLR
jgi:tRNA pseudouridine55 synthase